MENKDFTFFETIAPWLNEFHGVPPEAIKKLETDDDWTFVIKVHALLESTLNMLLISKLGTKMTPFIERLETGNVDNGKLAWAKELELMPKAHMDFIRILSPLPNKLAHNPRDLEFSFSNWISKMDGTQRKNFLKAITGTLQHPPVLESKRLDVASEAFQRPRWMITFCAVTIMNHVDFRVGATQQARAQINPKR